MTRKTNILIWAVSLAWFVGQTILTSSASAAPSVVPVQTYGSSYGEFSARWWQWLLSIPKASNPNIGGDCAQGQYDDVWFLPGRFGGSAIVTCTIPSGKPIFLPLVNTVVSKPSGQDTLLSLRGLASQFVDSVTELTVTIDGNELSKSDLASFRVRSPSFTVIAPQKGLIPPGNLMVPGNTDHLVSDGYWLLLDNMSDGSHTIIVHVATTWGNPPFGLDITYNLTVSP